MALSSYFTLFHGIVVILYFSIFPFANSDCRVETEYIDGLPNGALSGSSHRGSISHYSRSRLNTVKEGDNRGAWIATDDDTSPYIQADLEFARHLVKIATQGRSDGQQWITAYYVAYSLNNSAFKFILDNNGMNFSFSGNNNRDTIVNHTFDSPITSRFIRVYPQSWQNHAAMRWGVYGCNGNWLEPRHGYQYFVGAASLMWDAAKQECVNSRLSLASITDSSENDFIKSELSQNGEFWIGLKHHGGGCNCYAVADDVCEVCRNSWTWEDGTLMTYHAWRNDEPGEGEACGRLTQEGWAGNPCNTKYRFVCKGHLCNFIECGHGTCTVVNKTARCNCLPGITGENCETNIDECVSNPCVYGECEDRINLYTCSCLRGYTSVNCETDIDECASNPCQHGGSCKDDVAKYTCQCKTGFTGALCETNIDDCVSVQCGENSICRDGINEYTCQCNAGFTGKMCESDVDECASLPCQNGGTCCDEEARFSCLCAPGFNGTLCETDLDECESNPCSDTASCEDAIDGYTCDCFAGYTGDACYTEEAPDGLLDSMKRKDLVTALIAGCVLATICLFVLGVLVFLELRDRAIAKRKGEESRINSNALSKDAAEIEENRL